MDYTRIYKHYESCFKKHGDTPQGVDWPNEEDAIKRFQVMLECKPDFESLLDFGCGPGQLLDWLVANRPDDAAKYVGVDISKTFIDHCKQKHPGMPFIQQDILLAPDQIPPCDLVVANGVFTMKMGLEQEVMLQFFKKMVSSLWEKTTGALAFNVMSKQVDWEREDLFHLSLDMLANFLCRSVTRNFVIRNDYGLYEYTTYVYR